VFSLTALEGNSLIRPKADVCVLEDTARYLFSRSKRFEHPRKALPLAGEVGFTSEVGSPRRIPDGKEHTTAVQVASSLNPY